MTTQPLRDELVALTCELVRISSTEEHPAQLAEAAGLAERYARAVPGVHVTRVESAGKPSVVATLRPTMAPRTFLNAHLDVVPGRPSQYEPVVRDGRIYGRGAQDMKGSAAVLLRLLKDLAAMPEPPDVGFQFVSDEEIGGNHTTGYLAASGWTCEFFLAAEPTDMQICYAQKGVAAYEVELRGRPAHGSRPWDGENAFAALREGLVALERRYPTPDEAAWVTTAVPTIVHGGSANNRLPESLLLSLDVRHVPQEGPEQITRALRDCFPGGEVRLVRNGPPLDTSPAAPGVRRLAASVEAITGEPARLYREHFASDARHYSSRGIPAVCFGPVGAGLHSDEEWVEIASLEQTYHVLRHFVTRDE